MNISVESFVLLAALLTVNGFVAGWVAGYLGGKGKTK